MTGLSRRAFLQTLGFGLAAATAPWGVLQALAVPSTEAQLLGRVLQATPVMRPATGSARWLFPDQVVAIAPAGGDWYAVAGGRAERASLQPICAESGWAAFPAVGEFVQVSAPYAAVRGWCAPDAPLTARIGWGGVGLVEDVLFDDASGWLGLRFPEASALGWSPARAWRTVDTVAGPAATTLWIDRRAQTAALYSATGLLWSTPVALPDDLPPGRFPLCGRSPMARGAEPGTPWELDFGAWRLSGAYWHNRFGDAAYRAASGTIEAAVLAAQALYRQPPAMARIS